MIFANVNKGAGAVMASGDVIEIAADVSHIISAIYERLDDDSGCNITREIFRKSLIDILTNEDSPLFEVREANTEVSEG